MRAELKSLPAEQLREYIVDLRGIEYADDWSEARPVTLMKILEEAIANHPEVLWIVELEDAQIAQESAQPEPEATEAEPEKPSDFLSGNWKEYEKPSKSKSQCDLGKWEEYQRRALTTSEQNYAIKSMREEGYSFSVISNVVRLSGPTVSNRYKKLCEEAEEA